MLTKCHRLSGINFITETEPSLPMLTNIERGNRGKCEVHYTLTRERV